jgi:hypothetical protein
MHALQKEQPHKKKIRPENQNVMHDMSRRKNKINMYVRKKVVGDSKLD